MAAGSAKAKGGGGKGRAGRRKGAGKASAATAASGRRRGNAAGPRAADGPWASATLVVVLAVLVLRLGVNALGPIPVHFDEAQYWAYGQELDWGYFSKPPLVAWAVRAATWLFGDTLFGLRFLSPVAHAGIAWLIFLTGRRLWEPGTGFWAALGYTAAPGVGLSAMIMSTDPLLMLAWAAALYAAVRAVAGDGRLWWLALGALIGLGMLAKYTMIAFVGGGLGYGLFSAGRRDWRGAALAAVAAQSAPRP